MSNTERKVSISFDAPGVQEFLRNLKQADETLGVIVGDMVKAGASTKEMADALKSLGRNGAEVDKVLGGLAQAANAVVNTQAKAIESDKRLIDLEIAYQRAVGNTTKALELNAIARAEAVGDEARVLQLRTQQVAIQKELGAQLSFGLPNQPSPKAGTTIGEMTRLARGLRDALFGAGLGISLFATALGDKIPPAAQKATNSLRLVADTMLAGAFLFPEGGVGIAGGAIVGTVLALGAAVAETDPQIKALDDSLNKLGKKDDATQGLALLAKVTDANAEAALAFLKANPQLVSGFKATTDAAQGSIPVLQGVGDALRTLNIFRAEVVEGLRQSSPAFGAYVALIERIGASGDASSDAIRKLTAQTQAFADVQNEINNTTSRVAIQNAQEQIDKLREQGASTDELRLAMLKLLQVQQDLNGIAPSSMGARNYAASPLGISQADVALAKEYWDYISRIASTVTQSTNNGFPEARTASLAADKLGRQILDINRQAGAQLEQYKRDHNARLQQIEDDGKARRLDIERNFNAQIKSINDNLTQNETDARDNLNQSLADAEDNAAQERLDRASDYAARLADIDIATTDKRLQIEQTYQDKLRAIQEQYDLSLFDAVAHRDAKALIQAGMQREKSIAEAQRTRQRELDAAQKQKDKDAENARIAYEKQMRDLEQALARQEMRLRQEYERRIRDLEQNAQKQRDAAGEARQRELDDQKEAEAKQAKSENDSYKNRQADLAAALAEHKQSLIDALTQEQDISEQYAKAIVESLRGILAPDEIAALLNDVQSALSAEIDITIKPFVASGGGGGGGGRAYALGGYTGGYSGPATLHPNEVILPLSNASRTAQLMNDYVMPRMNLPMGGRGGGAGSMGASGKVQVEVSLNGDMLNAHIISQTDGVITTLLTGARGRLRV